MDLLDDGLAIDGRDDRLANATIVQRLDSRVEAVEPHGQRRTAHVRIAVPGDRATIVARRWLRVLEFSLDEVVVHLVELAAREDPIHEPPEAAPGPPESSLGLPA